MKKRTRHTKKSVRKAAATKRAKAVSLPELFSSDWYAAMFALLLLGVSLLEVATILAVQLQSSVA